jgi:hypothetical protein
MGNGVTVGLVAVGIQTSDAHYLHLHDSRLGHWHLPATPIAALLANNRLST